MIKKALILLMFLGLIIFIATFIVIYKHLNNYCDKATKTYNQDCVNSLIQTVQSNKESFRDKNTAVWALGQLADKKALPFLYQLKAATLEQDRCRYDQHLCRYEIEKAIKWCEKGNVTSWMYRLWR